MKKIFTFGMVVLVLAMFSFAQAEDFKYIGSKKCKTCHSSKKSGGQYKIWLNSKHAKAFETLATAEAKKVAQKMGIEDPQKSEKCLKCHVTGYGEPKEKFAASFKMEEGVGCESCHGPGSKYKSMKIMKDIYAGKVKGEKYGLVTPDEKHCVTCHNEESPTYKKFDYKTFWAKIAHPVPKKK